MSERLEEIQSRVWKDKGTYAMGDNESREGYIYTLSDYDFEWLIKQAERVEELERLSLSLGSKNQSYKQDLEKAIEIMKASAMGDIDADVDMMNFVEKWKSDVK